MTKWLSDNGYTRKQPSVRSFLDRWRLYREAEEFVLRPPGRFHFFLHLLLYNRCYGPHLSRRLRVINRGNARGALGGGYKHFHLQGEWGLAGAGLREVEWITGRPTKLSSTGMTIDVPPVPRWSRGRFLAGANKYIQQESTFWRRSLWERAGGKLSTEFRAEGDFELWVRFFRHARLYSVNALIGGYRLHDDALSSSNMERYNRNCDDIAAREVERVQGSGRAALKAVPWISEAVKPITEVRGLWDRAAIRRLDWMGGADWAARV